VSDDPDGDEDDHDPELDPADSLDGEEPPTLDPPEVEGRSDPELDDGDDDTPELPGETDGERSGPLGDLASRVDRRRETEADETFDDLFEENEAAEVDRDALWEQVGSEETFDVDTEAVEEPERRVVDKAKYCQSCRFFSEPPDVSCTHPETEILEVVDMDHFEVFNCPIVRENENLEQL
jgi:hypothetical protein